MNSGQSKVLIAKVIDVREGLLVGKYYQYQRVIVKSDFKLRIDSVNGVCNTP